MGSQRPKRPPSGGSVPPDPEAPFEVGIEDHLDLHGFSPREIPEVVASYLEEAAARGFREVRIVHGKGIGFQRARVRKLLEASPLVERFGDAGPDRGHWGATLVRLRLPAGGPGPVRDRCD